MHDATNPLLTGTWEVRMPGTPKPKQTVSGYFDNEAAMWAAVKEWDGKAKGIYSTMNPVQPELLARAPNCLKMNVKITTSDEEIVMRVWLLIDMDVKRPTNTSTTEAEHQAAFDKAMVIKAYLTEQGWSEPIFCDSGNGAHLIYPIDLPNDVASKDLVKAVLKRLAEKFDDELVKIDTSVYNAGRITKLYGTMACKGDNTPDRPYRRSAILKKPEQLVAVSREALEAISQKTPLDEKKNTASGQKPTHETTSHSLDEVKELLRWVPSANRDTWRAVGIILGRLFPDNPEAFAAYHAWADTWDGTKDANHNANMEDCFYVQSKKDVERQLTIGSLIQWAREGRLEAALMTLRTLSKEQITRQWLTFLDGLNKVGVQTLIEEVERLTGIGRNTLKQAAKEHREEVNRNARLADVGDRLLIRFRPEDITVMAEQAEKELLKRVTDFELLNFSGVVMRVVVQPLPLAHEADSERPPMPTAHLDPMTKTKLLPLVERGAVFHTRKGELLSVPEKVLDSLLVNATRFQKVTALITHPVVTRSGRIIAAAGIDRETGLLMYGETIPNLRAYTQTEAQEAVNDLITDYLDGFEFESPMDQACAVGMLLAAIERKLLPDCPGALILAAQQSVGKTTLARRCHLILTGRDLPVMTWPGESNEAEMGKLLLATLLRCPPLICFDNIGDGLTLRSPALAAAMTSPTKDDRILGVTQIVRVPTSTLFVATGNNVQLANDEVYRWQRIRLTASHISPHKRTFTNPDIPQHALAIREQVLRDCVGIIAGYRQWGKRIERASRFGAWDDLVRQPLRWAGVTEDIGDAFDQNIEESPEMGAHKALVMELFRCFPKEERFSTNQVIEKYFTSNPEDRCLILMEAVLALHAKDPNSARSVGHVLAKACGRKVQIGENVVSLHNQQVDGLTRYWVVSEPKTGS